MSVKSATLNLIKAIGDRITCTPQCLYECKISHTEFDQSHR